MSQAQVSCYIYYYIEKDAAVRLACCHPLRKEICLKIQCTVTIKFP